MAAEDYIHRIGRTARSTNTGTAYTFITRENSRHVPQLINVLKQANQFVSEQLQGLAGRGGFRGGGGGRGGYQQRKFRIRINQNCLLFNLIGNCLFVRRWIRK